MITDKFTNGYVSSYLGIARALGPYADVAELGVAGGDSLRLWRTLFPFGTVVGVDNDFSCMANVPLECTFLEWDQSDPGLYAALQRANDGRSYGLIVDDASHDGVKTAESFRLLWPLIDNGGFYVIEDWGVCFKERAPMYDRKMWYTATNLLETLDPKQGWLVDEIRYRDGLIVVRKQLS